MGLIAWSGVILGPGAEQADLRDKECEPSEDLTHNAVVADVGFV